MIGETSTPPTGGTSARVGLSKGSVGAYAKTHGNFVYGTLGYHVMTMRTMNKIVLSANNGPSTALAVFAPSGSSASSLTSCAADAAPAFVAADGFHAKARQTETLVGEVADDADFCAASLDGPKKKKRHQKNEQKRLLRAEIQTALRETCSMLREGSGRGKHSDLFAEQAVSRADVVFATLSSSGQAVVSRAENFDYLIVDEAAQALECELVVALARKPKRCLLVGDPAQLHTT